MKKKYIISFDKGLGASDQDTLKEQISSLNVNIASDFSKLGVMAVEVPDDTVVTQLRNLKGILAVEDDSSMNI